MIKSKKQRAKEVAIEQSLLKRGYESVKEEFLTDAQNPNSKRSSEYIQVRLKLMLEWSRPQVK